MRTIDQIKAQIVDYVMAHPHVTEIELGRELHVAPRLMAKILNDMITTGELKEVMK